MEKNRSDCEYSNHLRGNDKPELSADGKWMTYRGKRSPVGKPGTLPRQAGRNDKQRRRLQLEQEEMPGGSCCKSVTRQRLRLEESLL